MERYCLRIAFASGSILLLGLLTALEIIGISWTDAVLRREGGDGENDVSGGGGWRIRTTNREKKNDYHNDSGGDGGALWSGGGQGDATALTTFYDCAAAPRGSEDRVDPTAAAYVRRQCRWLRRQDYIAALQDPENNGTEYAEALTVRSPSVGGSCADMEERLSWDGACSSVGHRQKPEVRLVVSSRSWLVSEMDMGPRDCAASRCVVRRGDGLGGTNDSDLIIGTHRPPRRKSRKDQAVVLLNLESSVNDYPLVRSRHTSGVDWYASHRPTGGFTREKGNWVPLSYVNADERLFRTKGKPHAERRNEIPVFVSNCASHSDRERVISHLAAILPIESFGQCHFSGTRRADFRASYPGCAGQSRKSAMWDAQKECVYFHSKFALVAENSFEQEYVMEKLWQPLKMGAIPIVLGDPALVRPMLPGPNAAIFLEDFANQSDAAWYIKNVSRSEELWARHVAWKDEEFTKAFTLRAQHSFATLACSLCDKYALSSRADRFRDHLPSVDIVEPCMTDVLNQARFPSELPPINPAFGIDAVFVTHYTPLKHRRVLMEQRVRDHFNTDPIFVTDFDREVLSDEDIACLSDKKGQMAFIGRHTWKGEDSLTIKHMAVYHHMVRQSLQNVLVLEDDATFVQRDWRSTNSLWQRTLRDLPTDYDLLMLSGLRGFHHIGQNITDNLYLAQESRVSSMYLVSQKGARNMLRSLPIMSPIDFQINFACNWMNHKFNYTRAARVENFKVFHTEPHMSNQKDPTNAHGTVRQHRL